MWKELIVMMLEVEEKSNNIINLEELYNLLLEKLPKSLVLKLSDELVFKTCDNCICTNCDVSCDKKMIFDDDGFPIADKCPNWENNELIAKALVLKDQNVEKTSYSI